MEQLWEILVPTKDADGKDIPKDRHTEWVHEVRETTGGMTIMDFAQGHWKSDDGDLFREAMLPVRVMTTSKHMNRIIDYTLEHYDQQAVMAYCIADKVILRQRSSSYE